MEMRFAEDLLKFETPVSYMYGLLLLFGNL